MSVTSSDRDLPVDEAASLLRGPGEVRALMRACRWDMTPLGPPDTWPASLSAVVRVMLTSRFAMWMAWGPDLTFLCNDAYLPTVGLKRDWVIGTRSGKVWAEIWADIGPRIQHVLASGEATWDEALLLYLERSGFAEETERVIGERQLSVLRDVGTTLAAASTRAEVMKGLETCLSGGARDMPFAVVFLADREGMPERVAVHDPAQHVASAQPHVDLGDPATWPLAQADHTPVLVDLEHASAGWLRQDGRQGVAPEQLPDPPRQALIVPIMGAEGDDAVGYLVAGLNPHRSINAAYQGFIELLTAQVAAAVARTNTSGRVSARMRWPKSIVRRPRSSRMCRTNSGPR